MTGMDAVARYRPPGAVAAKFFRSDAVVNGIMGPVGSGKTSLALMKLVRNGILQWPSPVERLDGRPVRLSRFVSVRDTYRNLERTVIPTWLEWVPADAGEGFKGGSSGEPGRHILVQPLADGTIARIEMLFVALGDASIESVYDGFPMTGLFANGADSLHIDVLKLGLTRVGRFPPAKHGGAKQKIILADFNAPNWGDDIEKFFISEKLEVVEFFRQPGGMDDDAENLNFLNQTPDTIALPINDPRRLERGRAYYQDIIENSPDQYWVERKVNNKLGYSREGKPVYPEYDDNRHVSPVPLEPQKGRPIYVGADGGRWPAAVFGQVTNERQIRVLSEFVMEDVGATTFGEALAEEAAERYPDFELIGASDPAADNPTETSNEDDDAWVDIVSRVSKIKFRGTFSNKRVDREEGPKERFQNDAAPRTPGILIDPSCAVLRQAMQYQFHYKAMKIGGGQYRTRPEKNEFSHCAEAFEYLVQRIIGKAVIRGRQRRRQDALDRARTQWRPRGF